VQVIDLDIARKTAAHMALGLGIFGALIVFAHTSVAFAAIFTFIAVAGFEVQQHFVHGTPNAEKWADRAFDQMERGVPILFLFNLPVAIPVALLYAALLYIGRVHFNL
jgi:hypothetical protein